MREDGRSRKECKEGLKRRRLKATILKWFESSCNLLRETHDNSNYILLRIPIDISNSARGEKAFSVSEAPLRSALPLSPAGITRLQDARLIRLPRPERDKRLPIDDMAVYQTHAKTLAEAPSQTRPT